MATLQPANTAKVAEKAKVQFGCSTQASINANYSSGTPASCSAKPTASRHAASVRRPASRRATSRGASRRQQRR
ncbi:hypothetical protein LDHU3_31.3690:CDS1 [Leishmania donovani]|uniref:Hypothetical_protein n=2 Tax=Leishmania donovani species complex TaxID=38574 RepID=A0A6L0XX56_LEIIN|nr:hypothetical_protein [Leishmania infantum]CAJ1991400.1 hypothetical protein LDHU3_31.3690:CDS1 [Leishmania donovani]SUZ44429.1 hypothetical_protein [Leishmania infantum]VDZ47244.1 hypothetical_protein [Leishmania donovani]